VGIDENLKPYLRSPDGNFRLELGGFVQFDYGTGGLGPSTGTARAIRT